MSASEDGRTATSRRWRYVVGGAVIVSAIVYIILSSTQGTAVYALTIHELKAKCPAIYGQGVRVGGTIEGRSIVWDADDLILRFNLVDGGEILPVAYKGIQPDTFRDGAPALVEGKYQSNGVFEAGKLLLTCPSKYEAAPTQPEQ